MDHVLNSNFTRKKINMINKVRMFLQVETVAEIATPDGTRIEASWLQEGQRPSNSTELWPQIQAPSEKMWKSRRTAINLITQEGGKLMKPLGKWHCQPKNRRYKWSQDKISVYNSKNQEIRRHKIIHRTRREITFEQNFRIVRCLPTRAAPAEIPKDRTMIAVKEVVV